MAKKKSESKLKQKLVKLRPERLVEIILEIATSDKSVREKIERLFTGPDEKVARFKTQLKGLSNRRRFIDWREAGAFAAELSGALGELGSAIDHPEEGLRLVAQFFERCSHF